MTEEIEVYQTQAIQTTPAQLLNLAIEKGADLDKLEKLMDLQIRWEEREAKKAYTEAMATFKAHPPEIDKDKHVRFDTQKGVTEYNHASLANVTDKLNAGLSKHGLSASWTNVQGDNSISVTCRIAHIMGHSEETTLTAPPDTSGSKNSIQAIGSSITYLQRYTLMSLVGLAARDQDDDGKGAEAIHITDEQVKTISELLKKKNIQKASFLKHMKAESFETIPGEEFTKAVAALKAKPDPKPKERQPGED